MQVEPGEGGGGIGRSYFFQESAAFLNKKSGHPAMAAFVAIALEAYRPARPLQSFELLMFSL
jgi:hypothetical protein